MTPAAGPDLAVLPATGTAATAPTRIAVQGLSKRFQAGRTELVAVDDISFGVRRGEFVALLCPSGCGKSTILNMVAGLLPRSGGRILIDDEAVEVGRFEILTKFRGKRLSFAFQAGSLGSHSEH